MHPVSPSVIITLLSAELSGCSWEGKWRGCYTSSTRDLLGQYWHLPAALFWLSSSPRASYISYTRQKHSDAGWIEKATDTTPQRKQRSCVCISSREGSHWRGPCNLCATHCRLGLVSGAVFQLCGKQALTKHRSHFQVGLGLQSCHQHPVLWLGACLVPV